MFMSQGRAACDPVRLCPKPKPFPLVELTRVAPRTRQDIDARGVLPLNLRRLRSKPVLHFLLACRQPQRFLERVFRALEEAGLPPIPPPRPTQQECGCYY